MPQTEPCSWTERPALSWFTITPTMAPDRWVGAVPTQQSCLLAALGVWWAAMKALTCGESALARVSDCRIGLNIGLELLRARSSVGQSNGFLIRGSRVRITPGAPQL